MGGRLQVPGGKELSAAADGDGAFFRSLRGRFLFYFLVLGLSSLVLFACLFAFFAWRQQRDEEEAARDELMEQAQEMARDLELAFELGQEFPNLPIANLQRVSQYLRLEGKLINAIGVVVDEGGKVLVAPLPRMAELPQRIDTSYLAEGEIVSRRTELERMGEVFLVAVPLDVPHEPSYHNLLVAKRAADMTTASAARWPRFVIIAGAAALALAVVLALYLSGYVSRPLRRLSRAAWELAHGDLDSRVDVSGQDELADLSRYFNYMAERIQQSTRLQKDFVANVSHEIRTPLTSIEGFSQALLDDVVESEEDRKRYLGIIGEESRRLMRVLNQLLALSRIDAGAWALHPAPLDLRSFLGELEEKYLPRAREAGVGLRIEAPAGLTVIETDRDALEQVLLNLLDNALKFTPRGGEVAVSAGPLPGGGARIQVRDSGQGIPEEELESIFDRFTRVERSRSQRYGGAGLGLAVCRELLQLMGGSIAAWSRPGEGSVFTVDLPAAPPTYSGSGLES